MCVSLRDHVTTCIGLGSPVHVLDSVELWRVDGLPGPSECEMSKNKGPGMPSREFFLHQGRTWFVRTRESVRKGESETHITLELVSDHETRVVSCPREEWEVRNPDFAALLARSVASGASHQIPPPVSRRAAGGFE
jgi:hypothetical protein